MPSRCHDQALKMQAAKFIRLPELKYVAFGVLAIADLAARLGAPQRASDYPADRIPCRQADGVTPIIRLNERLNAASDS